VYELPPDPPRLRAILKHLDEATAENAAIHTYLDIQRNKVLDALKLAEGAAAPTQSPAPPPTPPAHARPTGRPSKPFKIGRVRTPDGPVPASVHLADCHMAGQFPHAVNAMEARIAITDADLEVCAFCRPDTELGIDTD
jgi:hypothetical protein